LARYPDPDATTTPDKDYDKQDFGILAYRNTVDLNGQTPLRELRLMNLRDKRNGREFTPEEEQQWDIIYNSLSSSQKFFFHSDEGSQFINNPDVWYSDKRKPLEDFLGKDAVDKMATNVNRMISRVNMPDRKHPPYLEEPV
jgi:hypothetical protein